MREILRRRFPEASLYLFGSRANGTGWRYSDCDVYVDVKDERKKLEIVHDVEDAKEEFAASDLPFIVDVFHRSLQRESFREFFLPDLQPL